MSGTTMSVICFYAFDQSFFQTEGLRSDYLTLDQSSKTNLRGIFDFVAFSKNNALRENARLQFLHVLRFHGHLDVLYKVTQNIEFSTDIVLIKVGLVTPCITRKNGSSNCNYLSLFDSSSPRIAE